ncbi:hypothetical protein O9K51_10271 [Purpureocillium lavendulum]|uniref:Uncharacterized protein n=1 Tax=Purpureocillium lavendulum TaxID=1247861 RepID=A0AB34FFM2_9HYPO|nr:hypothetical protein O9K51_10271 [Purpureocillium lavendulum]
MESRAMRGASIVAYKIDMGNREASRADSQGEDVVVVNTSFYLAGQNHAFHRNAGSEEEIPPH